MTLLNRREFTRALAGAALTAPFLRLKSARAGNAPPINKLIVLVTISPVRQLWNLNDPSSFLFGPALAPIKDKMMLFDGIPMNDPSANHGNPQTLSGQGYGAAKNSFDVAIARGLGVNAPIPNMVLGAGGSGGDLSIFWQDGKVVQPINDPQTAFNLAFASSAGTGGSSPPPGVDPALQMRRRTAILSLISDDIKTLQNADLTTADQSKLALHSQSVEQLRNRLSGSGSGMGGSSAQCKPTLPAYNPGNNANRNALLLQIGTEAVICGVTPVVGVVFGTHQGYTASAYDPQGPQFNGDTHNQFCHGFSPTSGTREYETWCASQFTNTVMALANAPAPGGGTMLDQTVVLWARDMGDGQGHNSQKMPYVLAGGGSYFKYASGGKVVDLSNAVNGRTHEGFLRTIADAMQVTHLDGFGSMPNAGLITELRA